MVLSYELKEFLYIGVVLTLERKKSLLGRLSLTLAV